MLSYCNHVDFTIESIERARHVLGERRYNELNDRMTDYSQRSSVDSLKKGLKQPHKITEAQRLNKVDNQAVHSTKQHFPF